MQGQCQLAYCFVDERVIQMSGQVNKAIKLKQGKRGNNRTVMALKRELSLGGVLDM